MKHRLVRLLISLVITTVWMVMLVLVTPAQDPARILVLLGGVMPYGLIQAVTYFLFIFGILDLWAVYDKLERERVPLSYKLLPETENWVLDASDANKLKLQMQQLSHSTKSWLIDIINMVCTKYRLSKSSSEALEVLENQIKTYSEKEESEQTFVNYCIWAIPSVGFIGTVIGIAASLGYANEALTPGGITKVTEALSVAFDTTLVALVLSVILVFCTHFIQKKQDELITEINNYVVENLINRFYK